METLNENNKPKEVYYFPFLTIRQWPSLKNGLEYISKSYNHAYACKDLGLAWKCASAMLFDDDACGILCVEVKEDKCIAWHFDEEPIELDKDFMKRYNIIDNEKNIETYFYPFDCEEKYSKLKIGYNSLLNEKGNINVYGSLREADLNSQSFLCIDITDKECSAWQFPYPKERINLDPEIASRFKIIKEKNKQLKKKY